MTDPAIPYGKQSINEADIQAVRSVMESGWLTTGPAVEAFEEELARRVGNPCVALSSGTAALHAAYMSLGLGAGDVVITTPLTFAATASTALQAGASVELVDVHPDTLTLDPVKLASAMHRRVRVVAAVDYAGVPADLRAISEIAHANKALVLEDASHSIGGTYDGAPIGSVADVTTFSFHPVKTITTGEGGALAARDVEVINTARAFRHHGIQKNRLDRAPWYQQAGTLGLNYRLSDIHAALGLSQLGRLDEFVQRRRLLVRRYKEMLSDVPGVRFQSVTAYADPAWHLFVVRVPGSVRDRVLTALQERGILAQVHYVPLHYHSAFSGLGFSRGDFPVAELAFEELISLPLFPDLSEAQQDLVVAEFKDALAGARRQG